MAYVELRSDADLPEAIAADTGATRPTSSPAGAPRRPVTSAGASCWAPRTEPWTSAGTSWRPLAAAGGFARATAVRDTGRSRRRSSTRRPRWRRSQAARTDSDETDGGHACSPRRSPRDATRSPRRTSRGSATWGSRRRDLRRRPRQRGTELFLTKSVARAAASSPRRLIPAARSGAPEALTVGRPIAGTAASRGYHPPAVRRYHVTTFGCQMNAHDSERIKGMLESLGLGEAADAGRGRRARLQHLHDPREARPAVRRAPRRRGGAQASATRTR